MARSLGLAGWRAWARRSAPRSYAPASDRPVGGPLLWIHAGEPGNLLALLDLAQRQRLARPELSTLITFAEATACEKACAEHGGTPALFFEQAPSEHPEAVASFWAHWHPDMAIWAWGGLRPNLIAQTHDAGCPFALIDADEAGFATRLDRWLPEVARHLLEPAIALYVRTPAAKKMLEDMGLPPEQISLGPPLQAGGHALPCLESDLKDLSQTLRGRPVWLACAIASGEVEAVLAAQRIAMRLSHRLLLIVLPDGPDTDAALRRQAAEAGFRLTDWSAGHEPDDATQVLLSTDPGDLGLFYRIAPVTLMGGSLIAGGHGRNPFEAAALGSAVLYGPNVRRFMPFYSRLAKAGAARIVKDGETLGSAVTRLVAPDHAAAMAHAGWDVVSEGADATDRIIEMVQDTLDGELRYARP